MGFINEEDLVAQREKAASEAKGRPCVKSNFTEVAYTCFDDKSHDYIGAGWEMTKQSKMLTHIMCRKCFLRVTIEDCLNERVTPQTDDKV